MRIWVYHHEGYVRLSVTHTEDAPLLYWYGGRTDEGFSYTVEAFWLTEDGTLYRESHSYGRDCDGPHEWTNRVRMDGVRESYLEPDAYGPGLPVPNWVSVKSYQRDAYAEAAGY